MGRRDKQEERRLAAGRVHALLEQAAVESGGPDADLCTRYAALARRVAMRHQLGLTPAQKARLCRACGTFRVPGRTSRTRVRGHRVVTTCLRCGHVRRRPMGAA